MKRFIWDFFVISFSLFIIVSAFIDIGGNNGLSLSTIQYLLFIASNIALSFTLAKLGYSEYVKKASPPRNWMTLVWMVGLFVLILVVGYLRIRFFKYFIELLMGFSLLFYWCLVIFKRKTIKST